MSKFAVKLTDKMASKILDEIREKIEEIIMASQLTMSSNDLNSVTNFLTTFEVFRNTINKQFRKDINK